MTTPVTNRVLLILTALAPLVPLYAAWTGDGAVKTQYFHGKVVPAKDGNVLEADDGKTYSLFKDIQTVMFLKDKSLLGRPMRITGRVLPSGQLQAVAVHSIVKDKLHDIFYWCEVCVIKRFEPGICDCCGAPLEFRELPVK